MFQKFMLEVQNNAELGAEFREMFEDDLDSVAGGSKDPSWPYNGIDKNQIFCWA